jgi:hypothetical protein
MSTVLIGLGVVGVVTTLRAGMFGDRILVGTSDLFFFQNRPERFWGPPNFLFNAY